MALILPNVAFPSSLPAALIPTVRAEDDVEDEIDDEAPVDSDEPAAAEEAAADEEAKVSTVSPDADTFLLFTKPTVDANAVELPAGNSKPCLSRPFLSSL